jgi:HlyD family secretion protein
MINNRARLGLPLLLIVTACARARAEPPHTYQGVVELDEVTLAFELTGKLERVLVEEGDRVTKGAILASLDDDLMQAERVALAREADALKAQAALTEAGARREDVAVLDARARAARASEDLLAKNLERERTLFEKNAVPLASVDQLEAELARARAERESAEAQVASLKRGARREERTGAAARAEAALAQIELTDQRIARTVLRAPIDSAVLDVHLEPGEVAAAGLPVVTLGDTRRPLVDVFVPQAELAGIGVGTKAEVKVDAEPEALPGKVEHVARELEFTPRFVFSERERAALVLRVRIRIDDGASGFTPEFRRSSRSNASRPEPRRERRSERRSDRDRAPRAPLRQHLGGARRLAVGPARRDLRRARPERSRQVDDDPHAVRHPRPDRRPRQRRGLRHPARAGAHQGAHRLHDPAL